MARISPDSWTAPVQITDKMLRRMFDNGNWGDLTFEAFETEMHGAWAEARYAAPQPGSVGPRSKPPA